MVVNLTPLELDLAPNSLTGPKKKGTRIEVPCPECDHLLKLGTNTPLGEELVCENCEAELEVIGVNPFELDLALPVNFKRTRNKKQKPSRKFDRD